MCVCECVLQVCPILLHMWTHFCTMVHLCGVGAVAGIGIRLAREGDILLNVLNGTEGMPSQVNTLRATKRLKSTLQSSTKGEGEWGTGERKTKQT